MPLKIVQMQNKFYFYTSGRIPYVYTKNQYIQKKAIINIASIPKMLHFKTMRYSAEPYLSLMKTSNHILSRKRVYGRCLVMTYFFTDKLFIRSYYMWSFICIYIDQTQYLFISGIK